MKQSYRIVVLVFLSIFTFSIAMADLIHDATKYGIINQVRQLIAKDVDVNAKDNNGKTPLHYAVEKDDKLHRDAADLLIGKGADVNAKDNNGKTPLHYSAENGYQDIAELLIGKGADVNAKDNEGKTPLQYAKKDYMATLLKNQGAKE